MRKPFAITAVLAIALVAFPLHGGGRARHPAEARGRRTPPGRSRSPISP